MVARSFAVFSRPAKTLSSVPRQHLGHLVGQTGGDGDAPVVGGGGREGENLNGGVGSGGGCAGREGVLQNRARGRGR